MSYLPPVLQVILAALVLTAGIYDIRYRRIPNWLVLTGLLLGLGMNTFLYEWSGLKQAALGLGLAFLVYFPMYLMRGMGAGDVKLMAAIGAVTGPANWFGIFILGALAGGIWAVLLLVFRGGLWKTFQNVGFMLKEMAYFRAPYRKREELDVANPKAATLPHGAAIAIGALLFLCAAGIWAPR